jgi:hypothetical protein
MFDKALLILPFAPKRYSGLNVICNAISWSEIGRRMQWKEFNVVLIDDYYQISGHPIDFGPHIHVIRVLN